MNRIPRIGHRVRRALARPASPPAMDKLQASGPQGQGHLLAVRPGRFGIATFFIQDLAAAASVAAGQQEPAPTSASSRQRTITAPRLLPHSIQLCIHCRQNPAGFWVSRNNGQTARRPWCLSCCQNLDPDRHHIKPFDS